LSIRMGSQEKVAQYINEARRMGIEVLPPDINESYSDFTVVGNSIRFGLSAIKNVGSNVIEQIAEERKLNQDKFRDFVDFCHRVPSGVLNKKTLESLIKAGVFDSLGYKRKYLMENFESIAEKANKLKRSEQSGQFSLFDETAVGADTPSGSQAGIAGAGSNGNGGNETENGSFNEEYTNRELLNFEKEILGLYISGHPLDDYKEMLSGYKEIDTLIDEKDKSTHVIAGVILGIKEILTKSSAKMYFLTLEDLTDSIEVIVFPTVREKHEEFFKEGSVISVKGRVDKKENREDRDRDRDDRRDVQIKFIAIEIDKVKKGRKASLEKPYMEVETADEPRISENKTISSFAPSAENEPVQESNLYKLLIKIEGSGFGRELVDDLHSIIISHSGNVPVQISILNGNGPENAKNYHIPDEYRVSLSEDLYSSLRKKFGSKVLWETVPDIR